jgi:hypothetical protein
MLECTPKQIHALWSKNNEGVWKLDKDAQVSARMLLEKHPDKVDLIPLAEEPGMESLAFIMKIPMAVLGPCTTEAAVDGTCE